MEQIEAHRLPVRIPRIDDPCTFPLFPGRTEPECDCCLNIIEARQFHQTGRRLLRNDIQSLFENAGDEIRGVLRLHRFDFRLVRAGCVE